MEFRTSREHSKVTFGNILKWNVPSNLDVRTFQNDVLALLINEETILYRAEVCSLTECPVISQLLHFSHGNLSGV